MDDSMRIIDTSKPIRKRITGSTLKVIAIISMFIDHTGAFVLEKMLFRTGTLEIGTVTYYTDVVFRQLGRLAFPIFCFMLVEGFVHTRNLKKYLGRLFVFALISEIPFDLALTGKLFYFDHQNTIFTLLLGILAITGIHIAQEKKTWHIAWRIVVSVLSVAVCSVTALLISADYDVMGVLAIVAIYLLRQKKVLSVAVACAILKSRAAFFALIPIALYNGERGRNMKWVFYVFYPAHLLLLYGVTLVMGLV